MRQHLNSHRRLILGLNHHECQKKYNWVGGMHLHIMMVLQQNWVTVGICRKRNDLWDEYQTPSGIKWFCNFLSKTTLLFNGVNREFTIEDGHVVVFLFFHASFRDEHAFAPRLAPDHQRSSLVASVSPILFWVSSLLTLLYWSVMRINLKFEISLYRWFLSTCIIRSAYSNHLKVDLGSKSLCTNVWFGFVEILLWMRDAIPPQMCSLHIIYPAAWCPFNKVFLSHIFHIHTSC